MVPVVCRMKQGGHSLCSLSVCVSVEQLSPKTTFFILAGVVRQFSPPFTANKKNIKFGLHKNNFIKKQQSYIYTNILHMIQVEVPLIPTTCYRYGALLLESKFLSCLGKFSSICILSLLL